MSMVEIRHIRFGDLINTYNLIYPNTCGGFIHNSVTYLQSPNTRKETAAAAVMVGKRDVAVPLTRIAKVPDIIIKGRERQPWAYQRSAVKRRNRNPANCAISKEQR